MTPYSLSSLKKELLRIKKLGFVKSRRKHSTGVGYTLESLLGIVENRKSLPDWGDIEIKAQRVKTTSDISLFALEPFYIEFDNEEDFVLKYGYPPQQTKQEDIFKSLIQTIYGHRVNKRGWKITISVKDGRLYIIKDKNKVGYIELEKIKEELEVKLKRVLLVKAETKHNNKGMEYFYYRNATLFEECTPALFYSAIRNGFLTLNPRFRIRKNGRFESHGTAFRIKKLKFPTIFGTRRSLF